MTATAIGVEVMRISQLLAGMPVEARAAAARDIVASLAEVEAEHEQLRRWMQPTSEQLRRRFTV